MATNTAATVKTVRKINLSKRMKTTHMPRRIGNALRLMREDIARHSKTLPENVKIGGELNRYLMLGAIQGFSGVNVAIEKTGETVSVDLAEKRKAQAPKREEKTLKQKLTEKTPEEKARERKSTEAPVQKEKKEEGTSKAGSAREKKEVEKKPHPAPQSTEHTKASGEQGPTNEKG